VHSACVIKDGNRRKDASLPGEGAGWRRRRWWRPVSSSRQTLLPLLFSFFYVVFFFLSVLDPSALSLLRVFSLLVRALCFSLLVPNLLRLSLRFVLLCVFPVVFGLYFSPFIPSFCFLSLVPSFFTRSCLTIVRHERLCFFE